MDKFDATADFENTMVEVQILIDYAKKNTKNILRYSTFNKSAIVLLCSKFESFLENFFEEYAFHHADISDGIRIDNQMLEHYTNVIIDELTKITLKEKRKPLIEKIVMLHNNVACDLTEYQINAKFNYGKHGEKQVKKLMLSFGFEEFIQQANVVFYTQFNYMNHIRNNIIHGDATPGLTHQDVLSYKDLLVDFAIDLDKAGNKKLQKFKEQF